MSKDGAWEKEAARVTSEVARRAIRRLDFLEWIILAATVGLAVGGGALVAWILAGSAGNFRVVWMITSVLLFIVPGGIVLARHRRDERRREAGAEKIRKGDESDDG